MGIRCAILLLILCFAEAIAAGQEPLEGRVSYITSQHVYVRFSSTEGLNDGDTLFMPGNRGEVPVLVILSHSSTSCVCEPLGDQDLKESDRVLARPNRIEPAEPPEAMVTPPGEAVVIPPGEDREEPEAGSAEGDMNGAARKQEIDGRFSVSSYTYLKNQQSDGSQRMRYAFSMAARNIAGSGLPLEKA